MPRHLCSQSIRLKCNIGQHSIAATLRPLLCATLICSKHHIWKCICNLCSKKKISFWKKFEGISLCTGSPGCQMLTVTQRVIQCRSVFLQQGGPVIKCWIMFRKTNAAYRAEPVIHLYHVDNLIIRWTGSSTTVLFYSSEEWAASRQSSWILYFLILI